MALSRDYWKGLKNNGGDATNIQVNSIQITFTIIFKSSEKNFEGGVQIADDKRKGVIDDSALHDLEGFDVVWDCPIKEFHNCKEGLSKQIHHRGFGKKATAYDQRILSEYLQLYVTMAVFSESPRRTRPISVGQFKGNEFGLLTLSAMPTLAYQLIRSKKDLW